jgi:hypothetical protein
MLSVYDQLMQMKYDQDVVTRLKEYPRVASFLTLRGFFEGKIKPAAEFFKTMIVSVDLMMAYGFDKKFEKMKDTMPIEYVYQLMFSRLDEIARLFVHRLSELSDGQLASLVASSSFFKESAAQLVSPLET